MKYKILGRTGLRVSELCLGTMTFGEDWGWGAPKETCRQLVHIFLDAGGNFIDTANYYTNGSSEAILGEILEGHRQQIVLSTKYTLMTDRKNINSGGNHRKNMIRSVEDSLRRLRTDYIDLYWMHIIDRYTPIEETLRGLEDLVRSGKILYTGISDTPAWMIAKANTMARERNWTPFSAVQLEYNLTQRTPERDLIPMAEDEQLSVLAWSPLAGGVLTGKYNGSKEKENGEKRLEKSKRLTKRNLKIAETVVEIAKESGVSPASVALAWVRQRSLVIPIIGSRKVHQLEDNLGCTEISLNPEQLTRLEQVSQIELGFPHDFIAGEGVRDIVYGSFEVS